MNRAQTIMTSVMASLAVAGPMQGAEILAQAQSQEQPDPRVTKAADDIFKWLEPISHADAKSMKDITKKFPKYPPEVIQKALKDDRIKAITNAQTGEVRYYGHLESHEG
jgi:hypothetical protein